MTEISRFVAYYRMPAAADTQRGVSLGRQKAAVAVYLDDPLRALVGEFTEAAGPADEVGAGSSLPAFARAIECCRALTATLVAALPEGAFDERAQQAARMAGVDVVRIEPAKWSPERTAERSEVFPDDESGAVPYLPLGPRRRALAPPSVRSARPAGNREKADAFARAILPIIEQIRAQGATSFSDIADALNARKVRTARGRRWHAATVRNVLNRVGGGEEA